MGAFKIGSTTVVSSGTALTGASIDVSGNSDANAFRINGTAVISSSRAITGTSIDVSGNSDANAFRINGTQVISSGRAVTATSITGTTITADSTVTIGNQAITQTNVEEWKHDYDEHLHYDDGIVNEATFDNWHFILGNMKVFGGIKATGNVGNGGSVDISFGSNHGSSCTQKPVGCHFNTYGESFSYSTNMQSSQTYKITIIGQFGTGRNIMWTCFCTVDQV